MGQGSKLKDCFPRLYALEKNINACFKDRWSFINGFWKGLWDWRTEIRGRAQDDLLALEMLLSSSTFRMEGSDQWSWGWDKSGIFTVKQLSKLLHNSSGLNPGENALRFWSKLIPKKVNIFIRRLLKGAITTRWNLSQKGIMIPSLDCVLCGNNVETSDHCLFTCSFSSVLWKKVWAWWGIKAPLLTSVSFFKNLVHWMGTSRKLRDVFSAVCVVMLWQICRWRNNILFAGDDSANRKESEDPSL